MQSFTKSHDQAQAENRQGIPQSLRSFRMTEIIQGKEEGRGAQKTLIIGAPRPSFVLMRLPVILNVVRDPLAI